MTTLTLIYAADTEGNFTNPKTGKCWDIPADRELFRETIKGRSIICGRKTFETDYRGLTQTAHITVLANCYNEIHNILRRDFLKCKDKDIVDLSYKFICNSRILEVLNWAVFRKNYAKRHLADEIFCIGGKQTIEAFAPFASKVIATEISDDNIDLFGEFPRWTPEQITIELGGSSGSWQGAWDSEGADYPPAQADSLFYRRVIMTRKLPIEF